MSTASWALAVPLYRQPSASHPSVSSGGDRGGVVGGAAQGGCVACLVVWRVCEAVVWVPLTLRGNHQSDAGATAWLPTQPFFGSVGGHWPRIDLGQNRPVYECDMRRAAKKWLLVVWMDQAFLPLGKQPG